MIEFISSELVISFPDEVHDGPPLRLFFTPVDNYGNQIPFKFGLGRPLCLTRLGRFMVHFHPSTPCAIVMLVEGRNAITGDYSAQMTRMPQNYFASPPQGGVDGFLLDGIVHNFYAGDEESLATNLLRIKIHPAIPEPPRGIIVGGESHQISGLALHHGGHRECEPIYEDCGIGNWDQARCQEVSVLLARS